MSKKNNSLLSELKGHLMTGISYMLPLVIGSSLVVAIPKLTALAMGITSLDAYKNVSGFYHILYLMEQVGWTGIGLLNTVLAGFIAFSIGEKPSMGAGFIGGLIASNTNAGFLGAVTAGFFAGYICKFLKKKIKISGSAAGMMPLIIMPLITVGLTGFLMSVVLAGPLGNINTSLNAWVAEMCQNGTNSVVLALILGSMIGFDLGGPVNKAAWMAGNALLLEGIYLPAILVNCAIVIPPLGYGLATFIRKSRFSKTLSETGKGNIVMGIIGITEGAIPFTLTNPLKLVPVNMIGCALGVGLSALLGVHAIMPPVGGLYGFISVGSGWAYLVGAIFGALVIAILSTILVDFNEDEIAENTEFDEIELDIM
ncbi:PTS system mannose-specfic transporter subunit IIC [Clostridioides difficile]|uniref:PTS fructose transporter subunit IIC n=1 Tax=Clostridioides difficile TaxID=1496 RepID=UPI000D1EAA77|nr:PTS fructose transporter subunit IIC [Clostridioides difficile]UWD41944.1 PTS fructose transporter subunit IIC [Clostridioides difficile]UWD45581.1 PTS fructose transporter subunit IIC [Clostridioides difficile]VFF93123.1 PTS system mannose-specfic transporter subunit IIC [Clostridioides difficile]VIF81979.1 PTS system mannose-specfic transporter subunit IIC [Clostridioides difficile]HBE9435215.1 PTS fructose transporter subunit IIC [Clostridioides difficile]